MPEAKERRLYLVPEDAPVVPCRECAMPMVFIPGKKKGSKLPLSIRSERAILEDGRVTHAPSHYEDCTNPRRFSGKGGARGKATNG